MGSEHLTCTMYKHDLRHLHDTKPGSYKGVSLIPEVFAKFSLHLKNDHFTYKTHGCYLRLKTVGLKFLDSIFN